MKKKTYSLKNRIICAVLIAVLAQSLFFGVLLASIGGITDISRQPYETMRLRLQDKNEVISSTLNHIYLEGAGLKRQIRKGTPVSNIHAMLIDVLNKTNALSAVYYINLNQNEVVCYSDNEPSEYSLNTSDIACLMGVPEENISVSMSTHWRKSFSEEEYQKILTYVKSENGFDGWSYNTQKVAFYYSVYLKDGGNGHLLLLKADVEELLKLFLLHDDTASSMDNMLFCLGNVDGTFYGSETSFAPVAVMDAGSGSTQQITWKNENEHYTGFREKVKIYGKFLDENALYVEVLGRDTKLQAPAREMTYKIIIAYLFSMAACFAACWSSTEIILEPLKQMLKDIQRQRGKEVHFRDSGAMEIQSIYEALNNLAKRLEQSHSRYNFTMSEMEHNIGSFFYHSDTKMTDITRSAAEILALEDEHISEEMQLTEADWEGIRTKLEAFSELNAHTFRDNEGNVHCVSFKTKEEEKGIFGVVTDKTTEYQKISHLKFVSEHDFLTKLHNASYLKEHGEQLLKAHKGWVNAMMFCDLDNLKHVNDNYGHNMGDAYIVAMADRMQWCVKKLQKTKPEVEVIASRIAGDEFAMLFTGFETKEEIQEAMIELYKKKCFIHLSDKEEYSVRVSMGIAYESETVSTIDQLLKCADEAMYSIKSRSKNGIAVYEKEGKMQEVDFIS